jgi:cardiolipin synthase
MGNEATMRPVDASTGSTDLEPTAASLSKPDRPDAEAFFSVEANRVRLLRDGREAYPAMLEAIARARREVLLEMYWIQGDRAGAMFRDAMTERAKNGVTVRVTYDALGSIGVPASMWAPLLAAGAQIYEFGPLSPLSQRFLKRLNFRDHRKILVVDGETAFTGGLNIGDPWLPGEQGGGNWRDDAIEVRGPAAADLRALFYETWRRSGRPIPNDVGRLVRPASDRVVVLTNRRRHRRSIRQAYLSGIRKAKQHIDITNPYFLPGPLFLTALRHAQDRGAEVRIMIPGQSDVWVVSMAMSSLIGRLLESDVRVFAYQGRVLHAKTAVFDETLAMVGTYNLDARSRRYNREVNVAVYDKDVARAARASFERDLTESHELSLATWKQRSLAHRFFAWFAYPLRQFL